MKQYQSDKIKLLSFVAIFLVMYIHSNFHNYPHEIEGMLFNNNLQKFISRMLGRCAVPMFYMISGYLFFLKTDVGINSVWIKMKKRVNTLLIPYIIACIFTPLFLICIEIIPGISQFMNGDGITQNIINTSVLQNIKFIFFDSGTSLPCAFQLWFLRDLIIIITISPVLYYIRKYINRYILFVILFCLSYVSVPVLPLKSIFFFMSGSILIPNIIEIKNRNIVIGCAFLFLLISIINIFCDVSMFTILETPIVIFGCICIWNIYDVLIPKDFVLKDHTTLYTATGFTFFIYLFHMPTMNVIRKLLVILIGRNSFGFAFSYIVSPILFAIIFILLGIILKKSVPKFYGLLVGGR